MHKHAIARQEAVPTAGDARVVRDADETLYTGCVAT